MAKRKRSGQGNLLQFAVDQIQLPYQHNDAITRCKLGTGLELVEHADEYFEMANSRIHVFPLKNVDLCWFRLYTDTSISKAAKFSSMKSSDSTIDWIDEAVRILDMALIVAGGVGREALIHGMICEMESYADALSIESPESKRIHLDCRTENSDTETTSRNDGNRLLPTERSSIPQITHPVSTLQSPSMSSFQNSMKSRLPMILEGLVEEHITAPWQSQSYWLQKTFGGRRLVPVEIGRSYTDDGWSQKIIPFRDFLDKYILEDSSSTTADGKGYLAQHDLFTQIPSLENDVQIPDYCYLDAPPPEAGTPVAKKGQSEKKLSAKNSPTIPPPDADDAEVLKNIWFGPSWTISPLHHDPYHNILCQVVGTKYIRLYSPLVSHKLFPKRNDEPAPHLQSSGLEINGTIDMSNTSTIDIAATELSPAEDWDDIYPGFSEIPYLECVLDAGQALYIPIGWWHYVRSCSVGISVSFWWK